MSSSVLYDAPGPRTRARSRVISFISTAVIVILLGWFIFALGQPRETAGGATLAGLWDPSRWDIALEPVLWQGLLWRGLVLGTLRAAGLAAVLAIIIGVLFALGRMAKNPFIRIPTTVLLEFFRGMPVLLMMLFILLGLKVGDYWAVVWALAVYNGAIIGEALRSGVASLPRGQSEAAASLGFTGMQTRFIIELPQAFRQMLPIIVAQLVVLLKDTSLAYIVAYPELLRVSYQLKDFYGSGRYSFTLFFLTLIIYLIVNLSLSAFARWLARRSGSQAVGATRKGNKKDGPAATPPPGQTGIDTSLLSIGQPDGLTGRTRGENAP
ncbi:amino acid ABC transporter permease [Gulosibacter molinativorax]|uniref:Amino acid ABC transporter permease n=1 Tax=Gulosibacter molinativorax TaxID=256821 RepID=A0ABT7C8Y8_9MICO|nr:amino acid ABC transporter permease [Gulosibacter molinativorax]MDJ1371578.1 amino acid ABC transporter permease [Gulosibacter molinativorax]QUY61079.1 Glutamate ABC transporter permease protein [Gulosibacter molinativorax]